MVCTVWIPLKPLSSILFAASNTYWGFPGQFHVAICYVFTESLPKRRPWNRYILIIIVENQSEFSVFVRIVWCKWKFVLRLLVIVIYFSTFLFIACVLYVWYVVKMYLVLFSFTFTLSEEAIPCFNM